MLLGLLHPISVTPLRPLASLLLLRRPSSPCRRYRAAPTVAQVSTRILIVLHGQTRDPANHKQLAKAMARIHLESSPNNKSGEFNLVIGAWSAEVKSMRKVAARAAKAKSASADAMCSGLLNVYLTTLESGVESLPDPGANMKIAGAPRRPLR